MARSTPSAQKPRSDRVRARRLHKRAKYDRESIDRILDAMPVCSVGYVFDGQPYVTPTLQWREGDHVYWHGSSASRMLRAVDSAKVCLTVYALDGFVVARSGFHHSTNYRSAMLLGTARKVERLEDKEARMREMVEGLFPGRWDVLRAVTKKELKATTVMGMSIDEASAKIRTGQPIDDQEDYQLPIWAGVIPVRMTVGKPVADPRNCEGVSVPRHVRDFRLDEGDK